MVCFICKPVAAYSIAANILAHGVGAFNDEAFTTYQKSPDNIFRAGYSKDESGLHVAQKPIKLMQTFIELTTQCEQIVLDRILRQWLDSGCR